MANPSYASATALREAADPQSRASGLPSGSSAIVSGVSTSVRPGELVGHRRARGPGPRRRSRLGESEAGGRAGSPWGRRLGPSPPAMELRNSRFPAAWEEACPVAPAGTKEFAELEGLEHPFVFQYRQDVLFAGPCAPRRTQRQLAPALQDVKMEHTSHQFVAFCLSSGVAPLGGRLREVVRSGPGNIWPIAGRSTGIVHQCPHPAAARRVASPGTPPH